MTKRDARRFRTRARLITVNRDTARHRLPTELHFRRFRPDDAPAVRALHELALRRAGTFIESEDAQLHDRDLDDVDGVYRKSGGTFLLGLVGDRIIAMGGVRLSEGGSATIRRMRVLPELQGRGVGRELLRRLEEHARAAGARTLLLDTLPREGAALQLYRSSGYVETHRAMHLGLETIFMRKDLDIGSRRKSATGLAPRPASPSTLSHPAASGTATHQREAARWRREQWRLAARAVRIARADELLAILNSSAWFTHVIEVARTVNPPSWWVNAGVIRDVVWGRRFGSGFDPAHVKDIDLGFFDTADLTPERDASVEAALNAVDPSLVWDAKNQAAVHVWYPRRFGVSVAPFKSAAAAIATFPEYCVCVGIRWSSEDAVDVSAPYGLDDLLDGVWRRNPTRVTVSEYRSRLATKRPSDRWPGVRVSEEP